MLTRVIASIMISILAVNRICKADLYKSYWLGI